MKLLSYRSILAAAAFALPTLAFSQISLSFSVGFAPPELPVYVQPPIPTDGYLWTPGYWYYGGDGNEDYFWVPGTWVPAPFVGALWTPGYWGSGDGNFHWHGGYWGTQVGYYGGINYGYGYGGSGYQGGRWNHGGFSYNSTVNNVTNVHVTNQYISRVTNVTVTHVSFNGGAGGVQLKATAAQMTMAKQSHTGPTSIQTQHQEAAKSTPTMWASSNHGRPAVAATPEAGKFTGAAVVAAKPGPEWKKEAAVVKPQPAEHAVQRAQPQQHAAVPPAQARQEQHVTEQAAPPVREEHAKPMQEASHPKPAEQHVTEQAAPPVREEHAKPMQEASHPKPAEEHPESKPEHKENEK